MRNVVFFLPVSFLLNACNLEIQNPTVNVNTGGGNPVSCAAVLDPSVGSAAVSGQPALIDLSAKGGVAPYTVANTSVSFSSSTTLSQTFTNSASTSAVQVDTIVIQDSLGIVAECSVSVTVAPATNPPGTLACALSASPLIVKASENIVFTATATGGTAPYTFSAFSAGANASVVSAFAPASATQSSATVTYASSALTTASVQLTDAASNQVSCSKVIDVAPAPSILVTAAPATSVAVGSGITLTATPTGFGSSVTYTFSTAQSGVSIAPTNNTAVVTSSTLQSAFNVTVTAADTAGNSASITISLSFVAPSSLACSLSHPHTIYNVGDTVAFTVTADSGEALQITYFATTSDGTTVAQTSSTRSEQYAVPGVKNVLVQAQSVSTGAFCQAGSVLSDLVEISAPAAALSCTANTTVNPASVGQQFYAVASISGGLDGAWVDTINVLQNGFSYFSYDGNWVNSTTALLQFFFPGSYQLQFNLKDNAGNTASCFTTEIIQ